MDSYFGKYVVIWRLNIFYITDNGLLNSLKFH